jgi:hypothetical protein
MKPTDTTLQAVSDIERVETTGQVRRIGSQMLLALLRKEISATDVEAGAKMIAAVSMSMHTEVKLAIAAMNLREKGADIAKVAHIGQTLIGGPSNDK